MFFRPMHPVVNGIPLKYIITQSIKDDDADDGDPHSLGKRIENFPQIILRFSSLGFIGWRNTTGNEHN